MVCKDEKADNNKKCSINKLLEISHGATVPMPVFYHILIISDVNTFFTPYVLNIFYLKALLNCIMKYFIMVFHPKVCCINSCSFLWCYTVTNCLFVILCTTKSIHGFDLLVNCCLCFL